MTQLLIYREAVAVSAERHGDVSVRAGRDWSFARDVNAVPLLAEEFGRAALDYPIVFTGEGEGVLPAVVLGARDGANDHVDADGAWTGGYVPGYLRRYPFVFGTGEGDRLYLHLDEGFAGVNREGRGERLFDADGERTAYLGQVLDYLQVYERGHAATRAFCAKLVELDLLVERVARLTHGEARQTLRGFRVIDREKLAALPREVLADLVASGAMEAIHAHLLSLGHLEKVAARLPEETAAAAEDGAEEDGASVEAKVPETADAD